MEIRTLQNILPESQTLPPPRTLFLLIAPEVFCQDSPHGDGPGRCREEQVMICQQLGVGGVPCDPLDEKGEDCLRFGLHGC